MSELIIISIKCLPTDDWDCERPNPGMGLSFANKN